MPADSFLCGLDFGGGRRHDGTLEILPSHPQFISRSRHQTAATTTVPKGDLAPDGPKHLDGLGVKVRHRHFLPLQREINQIERSNPDDDDDDPCVVTRIFAGANEASDGGPRRFRCPRWEDISPPAPSPRLIGSHCPQVDQGSWRRNWV